jgi:hypothetical protein
MLRQATRIAGAASRVRGYPVRVLGVDEIVELGELGVRGGIVTPLLVADAPEYDARMVQSDQQLVHGERLHLPLVFRLLEGSAPGYLPSSLLKQKGKMARPKTINNACGPRKM